MLKSAFYYALAILFSLSFSQGSVGQSRWQNPSYIKDSFIDIALGREYEQHRAGQLVRWKKPIKVYVTSDAGDAELQKDLLSVHIKHLSSITGHKIEFDTPLSQSNIAIVFTRYSQMRNKVAQYMGPPEQYQSALQEAICLGTFKINPYGEIFKGVIIIPVDYARQNARFLDCIIEEITQLLGLPNDSDQVYPSIFNDQSIDAYLSPLDYILLKVLYSPKLKAGMSLQQLNKTLDVVIEDLQQSGDIQESSTRVNNQSLKHYLGD